MQFVVFLLFILLKTSYAEEKIPIIAPYDGRFYWDDTRNYEDHYHDMLGDERCFDFNNKTLYCVHNIYIEFISNEEKCFLHLFDDIKEIILKDFSGNVKKGDLVGYASSKEKAKPKIINGC